jgi:hypothetical protein
MLANFHPDAQAEPNHAIDYYEANQPSLGYQFAIEVLQQSSGSRLTQPCGH